jgi:hypothetical protein
MAMLYDQSPPKSDAGRRVADADFFANLLQEQPVSAKVRSGVSKWYNQELDSFVRCLERVFCPCSGELSERFGSRTE